MDSKTLKLLGYEIEELDVVLQVKIQNSSFPEAMWLDHVTIRDQVDCDLAVKKVNEFPNEFRLVWFSRQLIGPDSSDQTHWTRGVVIPREQFLINIGEAEGPCWYCEVDVSTVPRLNIHNVTLQKLHRITIYPTSFEVLALAMPDRWQIVDRDWLDENEDEFGSDVCDHVVNQVLTINREPI